MHVSSHQTPGDMLLLLSPNCVCIWQAGVTYMQIWRAAILHLPDVAPQIVWGRGGGYSKMHTHLPLFLDELMPV